MHLTLEETMEALALVLPRMARQGDAKNHNLEISFFGGEPLTRFDYMQQVEQEGLVTGLEQLLKNLG